ncbi:Uncharacterised protein [Mycobacteroides abscessus subsp. abscessus]|nr:Uncharacterised protein [Mycobacteroides abscessus subsp. abscessus]
MRAESQRRIVDDLMHHRPGVGDHADAVLVDLLDKSIRIQAARQGNSSTAGHRTANAHQQAGLMMHGRQAVHGVIGAECGGRRGTEGGQRPPVVGDLLGQQLGAGATEHHESQVASLAGVGPVPAGQLYRVGIDLFHVDGRAVVGNRQIARLTTAEHQHVYRKILRGRKVRRVREQFGDLPQLDCHLEVGVRGQQDGDGTQPRQRGDGDQGAGTGLHQNAHPHPLPDPHLDEPLDHVVDAAIHRLVGVHPAVEQEALAMRRAPGLFGHQAAHGDSGVIVNLPQSG